MHEYAGYWEFVVVPGAIVKLYITFFCGSSVTSHSDWWFILESTYFHERWLAKSAKTDVGGEEILDIILSHGPPKEPRYVHRYKVCI